MPQAADAFAEVMAVLEKPGDFGLDAAGRKTVLGDEVRSYELFADAFLQAERLDDLRKKPSIRCRSSRPMPACTPCIVRRLDLQEGLRAVAEPVASLLRCQGKPRRAGSL